MAIADSHFRPAETGSFGGARVVGRLTLRLAIAVLEGSVAAAVVFVTAFSYHWFILHTAGDEFAWGLYNLFATLAGLLYGAFSATATARLLERAETSQNATIAESFYGWTAALSLTLLAAFMLGSIDDLSRVSLSSAYIVGTPIALALRSGCHQFLTQLITRGELRYQRVAVIGTRRNVRNFLVQGNVWRQGQEVTGTLFLEDATHSDGTLHLGTITQFGQVALRQRTDSMVIVATLHDLDYMERLVTELKRFAVDVVYAPATSNRTLKFLDVVPIGVNNSLRFVRKPLSDAAVFAKRTMDIVIAGLGLLVLTPFFAVVALAIKLDSPGPIIYRQARRGFNGETFMIWKFRSMRVMESGHAMTQATRGDPRVTRIGRFIRATSIDELPQLVNVLAGQMSIVGPRPHAISHDDELSKVLAVYAHRQRIKPGITGWAQVKGYRGDTDTFEKVEGRTLNDLHYIDNWSILLDLWILVLTLFSPATRRNAH